MDEEAKAIQHDGDQYFANSSLAGWQLWYSLDNDVSRFAWADENGTGVIYRMIDEWSNECPYDFKNIQMQDANNAADEIYYYTFHSTTNDTDLSLNGSLCYNNTITKYVSDTQKVNRIIFKHAGSDNAVCGNTFGRDCRDNTFHNFVQELVFEGECYGNIFSGLNYTSSFGTKFRNNTVGSEVMSIQIGKGAKGNVFKGAIYYSRFGNYFQNNIVGHYMYWSEFGHYVHHVIMGQDENNTISGINYITIENGVGYVNLYKDGISDNIENIKICSGVLGTSTNRVMIGVDVAAPKYQIIYANNSSGVLKKYCEADLIN